MNLMSKQYVCISFVGIIRLGSNSFQFYNAENAAEYDFKEPRSFGKKALSKLASYDSPKCFKSDEAIDLFQGTFFV